MQNSKAAAKAGAGRSASSTCSSDSPIGSIMATVAVLLIHMESPNVATARAASTRPGRGPTPGSVRSARAKRRSRPWKKMARARMNDPMKRNMIGSAKGANAWAAGATPNTTASDTPSRAVMVMGTASLIHSTTTAPRIAASRCAGSGSASGADQRATNTSGASTRPMRRRHSSTGCSIPFAPLIAPPTWRSGPLRRGRGRTSLRPWWAAARTCRAGSGGWCTRP